MALYGASRAARPRAPSGGYPPDFPFAYFSRRVWAYLWCSLSTREWRACISTGTYAPRRIDYRPVARKLPHSPARANPLYPFSHAPTSVRVTRPFLTGTDDIQRSYSTARIAPSYSVGYHPSTYARGKENPQTAVSGEALPLLPGVFALAREPESGQGKDFLKNSLDRA